jgi:hypothetical protein
MVSKRLCLQALATLNGVAATEQPVLRKQLRRRVQPPAKQRSEELSVTTVNWSS